MNEVDNRNMDIFRAIENEDIESLKILIHEDVEKNLFDKTKKVDVSQKIITL